MRRSLLFGQWDEWKCLMNRVKMRASPQSALIYNAASENIFVPCFLCMEGAASGLKLKRPILV